MLEEIIENAYQRAERAFGTSLPRPEIKMNNRLTATAGRANLTHNIIELSTKVMALNEEEFLAETPEHEAAHLIAYRLFGDTGHGKGWKTVMRVLGKEPNVKHSMKTATKKFKYILDSGKEIILRSGRHNKISKGTVYLTQDGQRIEKKHYAGIV
jgi:SprT protein